MMAIELKDWIGIVLTVWANTIATIALVITVKDKKKTAPKKPRKQKRKR